MEQFGELVTDRTIRLEEVKAHLRALTGDERYLREQWPPWRLPFQSR